MTDFFSHPDDFNTGKYVAFGYYEEPPSTAGSSAVGPSSHQLSSPAQANSSHEGGANYNNNFSNNNNNTHHHHNTPTTRHASTLSAGDINGMAIYTREAMSLNDVAAANTLSGFRNGPSVDTTTSLVPDGASWGAMSMTGLNASAAGGFGSDRQWLHASPSRSGTAAAQRDGNGNLLEMAMGDVQRGTYVPTPAHQGRPFVQYGSDTSFANGTFTDNTAHHVQKSNNLLGIPLAAQAAGAPPNSSGNASFRQSQPRIPMTTGGNSYAAQLTPQYSDAWAGPAMSGRSGISQSGGSNKRRRDTSAIGVKQEPHSEDEEEEGSSKRRKSIATTYQSGHAPIYTSYTPHMQPQQQQQPQYTNGLMMLPPQDMRRTSSRKKENLTDDQKRANHIISEKKRREIINQGYRDLNELTPALAMGKSGLSRSECLTEINNFLYALQLGNSRIIKDLQLDPGAFAIPAPVPHHNGY